MLYRPHRMYFFLLVSWLGIIVVAPESWRTSLAALTIIAGVVGGFYFQASSRIFASRLLEQAAEGHERACRLYLVRTHSKFGDVARAYVETLLKGSMSDERLIPLVVKLLNHPDAIAREMTEVRLAQIGSGKAAEPVVRAVVAGEFSGDGEYRARRLLYRWRSELPPELRRLLETRGYWQAA